MPDQHTQRVTPKRLPRASWLALLALAWTQLAIAGHQFEHSATYLEFCDACVQLERLDDVVAPTVHSLELVHPECEFAIPRFLVPPAEAAPGDFRPRAPPLI